MRLNKVIARMSTEEKRFLLVVREWAYFNAPRKFIGMRTIPAESARSAK